MVNKTGNWFYQDNKSSLFSILLVFFFAFTFVLRIRNISMPILDQFPMRQTHTAITIQSFIRDGLNIFDYQTPVLGPGSWSIPYEFPIYQAISYWLYSLLLLFGCDNIDIAARIVNIIFFYLSVYVLYRFSKLIFNNAKISIVAALCYVGSPFIIFWSRTVSIEFTAVFFAELYGLFFIKYLKDKTLTSFIFAVVAGIMGYLVKATSMLPIDIIIGSILVIIVLNTEVYNNLFGISYASIKAPDIILCILTIIVVPILVGSGWVIYADSIKMASGQEWLTSQGLADFNFGKISQRFDATSWRIILFRMPSIICITALVITFLLRPQNAWAKSDKILLCILLFAIFVTIIVFMNLYIVHDYYLIALCPYICMGGGVIISPFVDGFIANRSDFNINILLLTAIYVLVILFPYSEYNRPLDGRPYVSYLTEKNYEHYYYNDNNSVLKLAEFIKANTNSNDIILMTGPLSWAPDVLYYANRRGHMIVDPASCVSLCSSAAQSSIIKAINQHEKYALVITENSQKWNSLLLSFKELTKVTTIGVDPRWSIYKSISVK
jgi:hypothetical protein